MLESKGKERYGVRFLKGRTMFHTLIKYRTIYCPHLDIHPGDNKEEGKTKVN